VASSGQVPDLGQVGSVAPQLFTLSVGSLSGPIVTERTGAVAKLIDKQEPSAADIAKNLDQTREQILDQRREEVFGIFISNAQDEFKKEKRIAVNPKLAKAGPEGM
jgi:peptidyl-prolyl cis-trans isomerase D